MQSSIGDEVQASHENFVQSTNPAFTELQMMETIADSTQPAPETVQERIQEPPVPQKRQEQSRTYTVQRGDTLSKISLRYFGTTKRWKDIYNANKNKITNINQLKVGTQLTIPEDNKK